MAVDPFARFARWFRQARRQGAQQPEAMALASVDTRGRPSLRMVLLKDASPAGFVFYSDARSRKGRELAANPAVAATFYWSPLGRQVRIEGRLEQVGPDEADAYWRSRPRGSQLSAAASRQSRPLASRAELVSRRRQIERRCRGVEIPRPPSWTGYRIVPRTIEFWTHREDRLHQRELFSRTRSGWRTRLLEP